MTPEPNAIFVYGTLKQGHLNSPLLAGYVDTVEPATARGRLYDVGLYPALIEGEGEVRGELVSVKPDDLRSALWILDQLEEYDPNDVAGSMYVRRVIEVRTQSGKHAAHAYYYNRDYAALTHITEGEWGGPANDQTGPTDTERVAYEEHVRTFRQKQQAQNDESSADKPE